MSKDKIYLRITQTAKWKCKINAQFEIHCFTAPNWFHRKMQELIFGFKWEKM